jgi:hypothetical protein
MTPVRCGAENRVSCTASSAQRRVPWGIPLGQAVSIREGQLQAEKPLVSCLEEVRVSDIPETRYTRSGDAHIAYQISGSGPRDLVFIPPALAHLDLRWEDPSYACLLRRLGTFARVISLDKRGSGLSDREAALPSP